MRKMQKPPVGKTREKKQEPLAEGLQVVVPIDSQGRRTWSRISDKDIVRFAQKTMREGKITGKGELRKADLGLYDVLRKRGLFGKVGFKEKRRSWRSVSDEEVVDFARKFMEENGITGRKELEKADSGLYLVLRTRELLERIGFADKKRRKRPWKDMRDDEVVEYAKKVMREKKVTGRKEMCKTDSGLYEILRIRGLVNEVGFEEERKKRDWKDMSDGEVVVLTRKLMEEKGISGRHELVKADSGLYNLLRRRRLLDKVGFEKKQRPWKDLSDEEIVRFAWKAMKEKEITGRHELEKADRRLYQVLLKRGLLDRVGFEEKKKTRTWKNISDKDIIEFAQKFMEEKGISRRRELRRADSGLYDVLRKRGLLGKVRFDDKLRPWKGMGDEEVIEFAQEVIVEKEISKRVDLSKADSGLYKILRERGLLDRVFSNIEKQRTDHARDAVIDALTKFSNEKPEVEVA